MTEHDVQKESFLPLGKAKETKAASARKLLEYGQMETGETADKKLINDFEKTLESLFLLSMWPMYVKIGRKLADMLNLKIPRIFVHSLVF